MSVPLVIPQAMIDKWTAMSESDLADLHKAVINKRVKLRSEEELFFLQYEKDEQARAKAENAKNQAEIARLKAENAAAAAAAAALPTGVQISFTKVNPLHALTIKDVKTFQSQIQGVELSNKVTITADQRQGFISETLHLEIDQMFTLNSKILENHGQIVSSTKATDYSKWSHQEFFDILLDVLNTRGTTSGDSKQQGVLFFNELLKLKPRLDGYGDSLKQMLGEMEKIYEKFHLTTQRARDLTLTADLFEANKTKMYGLINPTDSSNLASAFLALVVAGMKGDNPQTFDEWQRCLQYHYSRLQTKFDEQAAMRPPPPGAHPQKRQSFGGNPNAIPKKPRVEGAPGGEGAASAGEPGSGPTNKRTCFVCNYTHDGACKYYHTHGNANKEKVPWPESKVGKELATQNVHKLDKTRVWANGSWHPWQMPKSEQRGRQFPAQGTKVITLMSIDNSLDNPVINDDDSIRCSPEDGATMDPVLPSKSPEAPPSVTAVRAVVADGSRTRGSRGDACINVRRVQRPQHVEPRKEDPQLLLDSGTRPNFCTKDQAISWQDQHKISMCEAFKVKTIHGSTICREYVLIPELLVIYKNIVVTIRNRKFYIIEDLPFPIILGLDTIRDFDLTNRFRAYFKCAHEREMRSEISRQAFNVYLTRHSHKLWTQAATSNVMQRTGAPEVSASNDPPGQWIKQTLVAAQTTPKVPAPVSEATTTPGVVVDKHTLLGAEDLDDDHIQDHQHDPWDRYFADAQTYKEETKRLRAIDTSARKWNIESSNEEHRGRIKAVLDNYQEQFQTKVGPNPANLPPFEIHITKEQWISMRSNKGYCRPQSPEKTAAIRKFIEQALADGVIAESQASQFSQVLLTPKPNGSWRFCIDYRALNSVSEGQGWPIPNIKSMLQRIGNHRPELFAVMDLTSGYHQAPLSKASQEYTAFITEMGLYKWLRVPMGPKGAPSYFQHQMVSTVLPGLVHSICEVYLDDICIYAKTIDEFCTNLTRVLERFKKHNITLNPDKCRFGMREVEYVGHVIDREGLSFSPAKLDKVATFRRPETAKSMREFLGLASYFRDHVHEHGDIVLPLQTLMTMSEQTRKGRLTWTEATLKAFEDIKIAIINCPKLHWLTPGHPVYVHTDASDYGIGAYLFQMIDGKETPIAFLSKTLSKTERKWSTIEKEAYAIYFALTKWEHHLRDIKFTLRTDHANLTYLKLEHKQKVQRWKLAIQQYDFWIEHIKGKDNIVADGLSRFCPYEPPDEHHELMTLITSTPDEDLVQQDLMVVESTGPARHNDSWKKHVIPSKHYEIIGKCHNSQVGHHGVNLTMKKVRQHLANSPQVSSQAEHWSTPDLRQDVTAFIRKCPCCQKMSILKQGIHTFGYVTATWGVFDNIAIDVIMGLPTSEKGNSNLMVIIDTFSRYVALYPMGALTSRAAAHALEQWMSVYGRPKNILTDNASQFLAEYEATLKVLGIRNEKTHPYSHEENAIVERANREIIRHLRNILFETKILNQWEDHIPAVQRIKNTTPVSSTGMAPAELVFGTSYRLEAGVLFPHAVDDTIAMPMHEYIHRQHAIQVAALEAAYKHQDATDARHLDKSPAAAETAFEVDSYVLVQYENDTHAPPSKMHPILRGPYQVIAINKREKRGTIYTCRHLATQKLEDFHVKLLTEYHYDAAHSVPATAAMADSQLFEVEEVLDHIFEGRKENKTNLRIKIKWQGFPNPTWERYAEVAKVQKVHAYLKQKRMRKYIQLSFKDATPTSKAIRGKRAMISASESSDRDTPTEATRQSNRKRTKNSRY